jgi:FMN-dependent NADH-azoreductase
MSLPHITDDWSATFGDPSKISPAQREYLSTSDTLIEELLEADTVLIGTPMHNFTISWELKAWIDQVVRLGKTVAYGANGPQGLLTDKKVVIVTSRGGSYGPGTPRFDSDFQEPYLRRILAFIGLTDVTFIHAESQYRREQAEPARIAALERIEQAVVQISAAGNSYTES